MSGTRIVMLIAGLLLALVGLGSSVGGGVLLWARTVGTDDAGFLTSPEYQLTADGYAITAEEITLTAPNPVEWLPWDGEVAFRVEATPLDPSMPIFVGIGPVDEVDAFLQGVPHAEVLTLGTGLTDVAYRTAEGTQAPPDPTTRDFWVARETGADTVTLEWDAETGEWAAVIMNADATQGVAVEAQAGVRLGGLLTAIGVVLLVAGIVLMIGGAVLSVIAIVRRDDNGDRGDRSARAPAPSPPPPPGAR